MNENLKAVMTEEAEAQVRQEISVLVSNAQALVITNEMENTEALKLIASYKSEIKRREAMDVFIKTVESKRSATAALTALAPGWRIAASCCFASADTKWRRVFR